MSSRKENEDETKKYPTIENRDGKQGNVGRTGQRQGAEEYSPPPSRAGDICTCNAKKLLVL